MPTYKIDGSSNLTLPKTDLTNNAGKFTLQLPFFCHWVYQPNSRIGGSSIDAIGNF